MHQPYKHDMEKIVCMPVYTYESIWLMEKKEPKGDEVVCKNRTCFEFRTCLLFRIFLEHMLNHMDPTQVRTLLILLLIFHYFNATTEYELTNVFLFL